MATTVARLQATLEADTRDFDASMAKSKAEMETVAKSATSMGSSVDRSSAHIRTFGKESDKTKVKLGGLQGEIFKVNQGFKLLENSLKLIKLPGIIAGIGLLIEAVNALAAGAYGLVAALAPLTGALVAYPAILAAVGQGFVVAKLAFKDLGKAVSDPSLKNLDKLTWSGRQLASTLRDLKPKVQELRTAAQKGLFPGVEAGLKSAIKNFDILKPIVADTGTELGKLAAAAGHLVGSKGFGAELTKVGTSNVKIINNLGTAAISLSDGLVHLVGAAAPFTQWLTKVINLGAQWFDSQVKAGEANGKLAGFLRQTHSVMVILGDTLKNLFIGLYNIGKIAAPLGTSLLKEFRDLTETFKEWTDSAKGKNQIAAYFKQAKPALDEMFKLVGAIGGAFLSINQGSTLAPLLKQIRTQLVPVLQALFQNTAKALGPALINTLTQLATLFGKLAGTSGPLTTFVKAVGKFAQVLTYLLDNVPGLSQFVILWFGFSSVLKAMNFTFAISGLKSMVGWLWKLVPAETAAAASAKLAAAGTWLLNAALDALPWVALAVAIGVAAYEIYKHWDSIKKYIFEALDAIKGALSAAWEWIKTKTLAAWNAIRDYVINPIKNGVVFYFKNFTLPGLILSHWETIKHAAQVAWNTIRDYIINPIKNGVIFYFQNFTLPGLILSHWNTIKTDAKRVWNEVVTFITNIPARIAKVFDDGWDVVKTAVSGLFHKITGWIYDFLGIKSPSTVFHDIGSNMIQGFINGVLDKAGALKSYVIKIVKSVPGFFANIAKDVGGAVLGGGGAPKLGPGARGKDTYAGYQKIVNDVGDTTHADVVSQVDAAVGFAMTQGWRGSITSALRTHAEQQALWDGAPANGLIRGVTVARPGTSSHERGEAVDVSDVAGFKAAMGRAPAWAKLLWRGPSDPVHFSISGHKYGGIATVPMIGEAGPEAIVPFTGQAGRKFLRLITKAADPTPLSGDVVIPVSIGGTHVGTVLLDLARKTAKPYENRNGRGAF